MAKWTEMQVFVESVRQGSFSAAGRQLDLSPSAVSKLLTRLETRLGVRLLNRTTRMLSLTEGGQIYFNHCVDILAEIDDVEDALTGLVQEPAGTLRINSTHGFAKHQLLPIMPMFQARYPKIKLEFQLSGQAVDLIAEGVDLAIRLGELKDTNLVARKLGESERLVCASPHYIDSKGTPQKPSDLLEHNCLRLSTNEIFNHWQFTSHQSGETKVETFNVTGSFVTDNVDGLHEYALLGGGIARLSSFMINKDIEAGRLIPLLTNYGIPQQKINALYPHRKHLSAKVRVFLDYLTEQFAAKPPWS